MVLDAGTLRLTPFRPLGDTDRAALVREADQLLPFVGATTVAYDTATTRPL
ncbi:MAG TPA: hypothetical protein VGN37_04860 [Actinocatenispora sp.]